jgi:gluconate 5-dehydrogenase
VSIQLDFSGEIALVTGAATGLGFAIARAFGRCGAAIALNDLMEDRVEAACERLRQESIACRGYLADVRDAGAVSALITAIEDEMGAPSVVVANAGLYPNTPSICLRRNGTGSSTPISRVSSSSARPRRDR